MSRFYSSPHGPSHSYEVFLIRRDLLYIDTNRGYPSVYFAELSNKQPFYHAAEAQYSQKRQTS